MVRISRSHSHRMTAAGAKPASGVRAKQIETFLESLPEASWVLDAEGRITHCNQMADKLCGYPRAELLTLSLRQLLAYEPPAGLDELRQKVIGSGETVACRVELLARHGAHVPVELSICLLNPGELKRYLLLCVAHEVSAGVDPRFKMLAANTREMLLAYDMERRLIYANPAAERLTGYSQEELETAGFVNWIHEQDRERMLAHWEGLFRGESFEEEEYRLLDKEGRLKWVAASWGPLLDDSGNQVGVQGRERDITARRLAELAQLDSARHMRQAEAHYRALFEDSPVPMWEEDFSAVRALLDQYAVEAAGNWRAFLEAHPALVQEAVRCVRIRDINRSAREFYGAGSREELVRGFESLFDASACAVFRDELAAFASGQSLHQASFEARTLRGEVRAVRMFVSLESGHAGDWSHVIAAFLDVTESKRLNEEYLQAQKMESLGRLAGGVAHDVNNLLTVVNGYSDLLLSRLPEGDPARRWVNEIRKAGQTGADLMSQLLTFSRRQPQRSGTLGLNELIREMEPMIRRMVGDDVGTVVLLDPDAGLVQAEASLMRQLVLNLVANAREAMPRGGVLTIATRLAAPSASPHGLPVPAGGRPVVLLISDTGTGMDEDVRQHLFEPFFTTKNRRLGSGLGLASVFGMVNQQGGHIEVSTEPGKGSTFTVWLVQAAPSCVAAIPPPKEAQAAAAGGGKETVLVAEDQPEVRNLAGSILERMGFQVLLAGNGSEALVIASRHPGPIRLLLTDIVMPGMNGLELADRLAASRPETRVIYMSGYADQELDGGQRLAGGAAFLPKPFTPDSLTALVRRVLGAAQAAAAGTGI